MLCEIFMTPENIHPQQFKVDREKRRALMGHPSFLIWFTGLSGSGKSTLAERFEDLLFQKGMHTYLLDGDNIRSGLNGDLGFSDQDRKENIRRIGEVANLMTDAGVITLAAFISPFASEREWVKQCVGSSHFFEVFVDCPIETCETRDVKGLYQKARRGEIPNFTGISSPYEPPRHPNLIIDTSKESIENALEKLWLQISSRFGLNA